MTSVDVLKASDISLSLADEDKLLLTAGFSQPGAVQRFLQSWGRALESLPSSQMLHNSVFLISPSTVGDSLPAPASIGILIQEIAAAQSVNQIITADLQGTVLSRLPISSQISANMQAGTWTHLLASRVSHEMPNFCLCYVANRAVSIFTAGTQAIGYDDIVTNTPSSNFDLIHRETWSDGELLARCGTDRLQDRGRRGVWEDADLFLLRNSPEELMEDILTDYLQAKLRGFQHVERQNLVPNEGRVDVLVTLADGRRYLVEIKWVGRSVKKGVDVAKKKVVDLLRKKWINTHVFVLNDDAAHAGVIQLGYYHKKLRPVKCYLIAYDCRWIEEQKDSACAKDYPLCKELAAHQYRIYHIGVDPRPASVKGKAAVAGLKATRKLVAKKSGLPSVSEKKPASVGRSATPPSAKTPKPSTPKMRSVRR